MNAIPDKFAQWDAARCWAHYSWRPTGVRRASGQLSRPPGGRLGAGCLPGLLAQISPADAAMLSLADDARRTQNRRSRVRPRRV